MVRLPLLAGSLLTGCDDSIKSFSHQTIRPHENDVSATKAARLAAIKDLLNGVYIFPAMLFPETLSDFKELHPNLKVTGWGVGDCHEGTTTPMNYVVNTEPR
jgi:hypothetical protein